MRAKQKKPPQMRQLFTVSIGIIGKDINKLLNAAYNLNFLFSENYETY
jgi:hypothetical protein